MYFLRRLRPLEVVGDRVRMLRVSLNAPVLSTPDLPVGPARAMLVVQRDARGRLEVAVGARALRGGEVAYWSFDGELSSEADIAVAADAALTFAESLGFLFDDAALGAGAAADKAWRQWIGGETPPLARPGRADTKVEELPELELDVLADEAPLAPIAEASPGPAAAPPPPPGLSKFRSRPAGETAAPIQSRRRPLARVQLVKRRSPEEERRLFLRRLLTSF